MDVETEVLLVPTRRRSRYRAVTVRSGNATRILRSTLSAMAIQLLQEVQHAPAKNFRWPDVTTETRLIAPNNAALAWEEP
jgi:hypothetical protein